METLWIHTYNQTGTQHTSEKLQSSHTEWIINSMVTNETFGIVHIFKIETFIMALVQSLR